MFINMFRLVKSSVRAVLMAVVVASVGNASPLGFRCCLTSLLEVDLGFGVDLVTGGNDVDLADDLLVTGLPVVVLTGALDTRRPDPET
jgi:hypothetical protein